MSSTRVTRSAQATLDEIFSESPTPPKQLKRKLTRSSPKLPTSIAAVGFFSNKTSPSVKKRKPLKRKLSALAESPDNASTSEPQVETSSEIVSPTTTEETISPAALSPRARNKPSRFTHSESPPTKPPPAPKADTPEVRKKTKPLPVAAKKSATKGKPEKQRAIQLPTDSVASTTKAKQHQQQQPLEQPTTAPQENVSMARFHEVTTALAAANDLIKKLKAAANIVVTPSSSTNPSVVHTPSTPSNSTSLPQTPLANTAEDTLDYLQTELDEATSQEDLINLAKKQGVSSKGKKDDIAARIMNEARKRQLIPTFTAADVNTADQAKLRAWCTEFGVAKGTNVIMQQQLLKKN